MKNSVRPESNVVGVRISELSNTGTMQNTDILRNVNGGENGNRKTMKSLAEKVIKDKNVQSIFKKFSAETSLPGLGRLGERGIGSKVAIATIMLVSLLVFMVHCTLLVIRYLRYPVTVATSYDEPFVWPDITLCNLVPYSVTLLQEIRKANKTDDADKLKLKRRLSAIDKAESWLPDDFEKEAIQILQQGSQNMSLVQHRAKDFIMGCTFRNQNCNFTDFDGSFVPRFYRCHTYQTHGLTPTQSAPDVLDIMMFIESGVLTIWDKRTRANFSPAGKIFVHASGSYPNVAEILDIPTGSWVMIALTYQGRSRIETPLKPCSNYGEHVTYSTPAGDAQFRSKMDQNTCVEKRLQEEFHRRCGCISEKFRDFPGDVRRPPCHLLDDVTTDAVLNGGGEKAIEQLVKRTQCHRQVFRDLNVIIGDIRKTDCPVQCAEKSWAIRLSPHIWPKFTDTIEAIAEAYVEPAIRENNMNPKLFENSGLLDKNSNVSIDERKQFVQSRFLRLTIAPTKPNGIKIEEERAYPVESLLSEVGGILGMYLGVSIIFIYEVIELVKDLIIYYRRGNKSDI